MQGSKKIRQVQNDASNRARLLKSIPKDRQLLLAKALEKHGIEDDDPLVLLGIEILEGEARHIQAEFKRYHPLLEEIYQEETWHKLLTSKLMTFVIGPLAAGTIFFTVYAFARKSENEALQKLVDEPQSVALAINEGSKAMKNAKADMDSMRAAAVLMNIPEAVFAIKGKELLVQFPKNKATVTETEDKVIIKLSDPTRHLRNVLGAIGGGEK